MKKVVLFLIFLLSIFSPKIIVFAQKEPNFSPELIQNINEERVPPKILYRSASGNDVERLLSGQSPCTSRAGTEGTSNQIIERMSWPKR